MERSLVPVIILRSRASPTSAEEGNRGLSPRPGASPAAFIRNWAFLFFFLPGRCAQREVDRQEVPVIPFKTQMAS